MGISSSPSQSRSQSISQSGRQAGKRAGGRPGGRAGRQSVSPVLALRPPGLKVIILLTGSFNQNRPESGLAPAGAQNHCFLIKNVIKIGPNLDSRPPPYTPPPHTPPPQTHPPPTTTTHYYRTTTHHHTTTPPHTTTTHTSEKAPQKNTCLMGLSASKGTGCHCFFSRPVSATL